MKRRREKYVIMLMVAVLLGIVAFVAFLAITESRRSRALVKAKAPEALAFYDSLLAQKEADEAEETAGGRPRESAATASAAVGRRSPRTAGGVADASALSSLAGFERLLEWHREALGDGQEWEDLRKELFGVPIEAWTEDQRARMLAFLEKHRDLIAEIRRMADQGGPVYPLDFSVPFYEVEMPHLSKLRDLGRLLHADALGQALQGNYRGAVDDIVAQLRLADALEGEPIIISQLVRYSMKGIGTSSIVDAFDWGEVPPELTRELLVELNQGRGREALADALGGAQEMGMDVFKNVAAGEDIYEAIGWTRLDGKDRAALWLYSSSIARPWLNIDQELYVESVQRAREAALLPYWEAKPLLDALEQDIEDMPFTRVFTTGILPSTTRIQQARARNESEADLARVGLALELYYQERGSYPDQLDAVASYLGGTMPVDTYTGQPFRYTPRGERFELYSLGQNLTDEGGEFDYREGDIVWRHRRPSHFSPPR